MKCSHSVDVCDRMVEAGGLIRKQVPVRHFVHLGTFQTPQKEKK